MEPAVWGLIGTLAGAVVGAAASIVTTVIASRNAIKLQRQSDSLEREERARAFQRDNLLQLQDAITHSLRLMGRAHIEDHRSYKKSGTWGTDLLSEELDQEIAVANRHLSVLIERLSSDELRTEVKALHGKMVDHSLAQTPEDAEAHLRQAVGGAGKVMENVGLTLRNHY